MITISKREIEIIHPGLYKDWNGNLEAYVKEYFSEEVDNLEYIVVNEQEVHLCSGKIVNPMYQSVHGYGYTLVPHIGIHDNISINEIKNTSVRISQPALVLLFAITRVSMIMIVNGIEVVGSLRHKIKEIIPGLPDNIDFYADVYGTFLKEDGYNMELEAYIRKLSGLPRIL